MFKSCCSRSKKMSKSKSKSNNLDAAQELNSDLTQNINIVNDINNTTVLNEVNEINQSVAMNTENQQSHIIAEEDSEPTNESDSLDTTNNDDMEGSVPDDLFDPCISKKELMKKRYSVDYKRNRHEFKRYSVDFRADAAKLDELSRLEKELARTNVDVRPPSRRKSVGILKSTTSYSDIPEDRPAEKPDSFSEDDEVFEAVGEGKKNGEGTNEPPATPVGRDELALRRHRFFSDLVCAARAAVEHRVRFDPLGPIVADQGSDLGAVAAIGPASDLEALIERLELVTLRLERLPVLRARSPPKSPANSPQSTPPPSPPPEAAEDIAFIATDDMSVNGYQDLLQGPLSTYLSLSEQIGGDVASHAKLVNAAFQAQLRYIQLSATRSKPSPNEQVSLLSPTSDQISAIQQYREKNRASQFFNHLSAISESIPALGWVAIAPTPGPYVKEMNDAGQFYTNRVLKEWKEKNKTHAEWCRAWVQLLTDLQAYVKQHHTTGLVWSGTGAGAPPPPPGPPPPPCMPLEDFSNMSLSDDRSALFAEINKGEGITSSLRKVTTDMQTHKNPQLRQGPAPFRAPAGVGPTKPLPGAGAGTIPDKPPVFNRDGKKWIIEYQKGNQGLVVEDAEMNNVVYMFRCRDSSLTVRGKINGVVLDSCTKCALVFDNLVSSAEFVNCQSVQMQVLGKVPTVSIDKTDGCQVYLSKDSLGVEIISSKSSEINVLVPKANGDYTELAVPEQYKTVVKGNSLQTTPVESLG